MSLLHDEHRRFLAHLPEEQREPFAATAREAARTTLPVCHPWFMPEDGIEDECAMVDTIVDTIWLHYEDHAARAVGRGDADARADATLALAVLDRHGGAVRGLILAVMAEERAV